MKLLQLNRTLSPNSAVDPGNLEINTLDLIFHAITDLIIVTDSQGIIRSSNRSRNLDSEWDQNEFREHEISSYFSSPLKEDLENIFAGKDSPPADQIAFPSRRVQWIKHDGSLTPVSVSFSPLPLKTGFSWIFVIRDITNVLQTEHELEKQTEELSRSNLELRQFASVVAHDLQAPLRTILTFTQNVVQKSAGKLDEESHDLLNRAAKAAGRMRLLISDILTLSRVQDAPRATISLDVNELFDEIRADLKATIDEASANITRANLPFIDADRGQFRQLLQNFLTNALKFRDSSTSPIIHLSCIFDGEFHVFCLSDNGIGIDPAHFSKIFERFNRLHSKNEFPGNGLGLTICQKIVENLGGKIWLESAPGRGSKFYFKIRRSL